MLRFRTLSWPLAACFLLLVVGCHESTTPAEPEPEPEQSSNAKPSARTNWPIYRGNRALHGLASGKLGTSLELAWSFETKDAIISSPVVIDGTVYVGSSDRSVYAVDLESGKKRWSYATDDIIDAPPLVLDGRIYVGSYDFFFYALDAKSGDLVWKFETGDKIVGGANYLRLPDGSTGILVGSYDNKLYCLDATTGAEKWTYETDNFINATPAVLDDRIVFGGCDAVLHIVSAATGKSLAEVELGPNCQVAASVALAGNKAYFGHYGNAFVCVNLETEEPQWVYSSRQHAFFSSPAITEDRVVFGGRDKSMHCVRRSDGKPLWTFPTKRKIDGSPVVCGDRVVFGSGDGRLYVVNLSDGKEVWRYEIGQSIFSSPAVVGGMVVVGSGDGRLYAFR